MGTADIHDEMWRKVPGTKYTMSNFGRMKNGSGKFMAPGIVKNGVSTRYCLVINGVKRSSRVMDVMARVWPEESLSCDLQWMARIRKMNGQFGNVPAPSRAVIGDGLDPWDTMHLWNECRDYFNFAQYVPVI